MLFIRKILFLFVVILGTVPFVADAFGVHKINNAPVTGNFSVSPGKSEFNLTPGQKINKAIIITNKTGKRMEFEIGFEDFVPSFDDETPLQLGKSGKDTSLKNYLSVDRKIFSLEQGEVASVIASIEIPKIISSSGLFGAVMVSAYSSEDAVGLARVLVQIPSLFFVRITGNEKPAGGVTDFKYEDGAFSVTFENRGNVHLNPAGQIELKNIFGQTAGKINIDPWFIMPVSSRSSYTLWNNRPDTYLYEADLTLSPGFGGQKLFINKRIWIYSMGRITFSIIIIFAIILFGGLIKYLRK